MEVIKFERKYLTSNKKMYEINMYVNGIQVGYCFLTKWYNTLSKETIIVLDAIAIYPKYRGKGYANKLMEELMRKSKRNSHNIKLSVDPFDDKPLNVNQLKKFYSQYGFETCTNSKSIMIWYNPKNLLKSA